MALNLTRAANPAPTSAPAPLQARPIPSVQTVPAQTVPAQTVPAQTAPVQARPVAPVAPAIPVQATPVINAADIPGVPVASPALVPTTQGAEELPAVRPASTMKMGQVSGIPDTGSYLAPFITLLDPNSKFCKKDPKNYALAGNWLYDNEIPFGIELNIIPIAIRCFIVESQKWDPAAPEESQQAPKKEWATEQEAIAEGYVRHDSTSEKYSNLLYTNAVTMLCMVQAPQGLEENAMLKIPAADGQSTYSFYPAVVNVRKTKAGPVSKIAKAWLSTGGSSPLFSTMWKLGSEFKDRPVRYLTTKVSQLGATPKEIYEKLFSMYASMV